MIYWFWVEEVLFAWLKLQTRGLCFTHTNNQGNKILQKTKIHKRYEPSASQLKVWASRNPHKCYLAAVFWKPMHQKSGCYNLFDPCRKSLAGFWQLLNYNGCYNLLVPSRRLADSPCPIADLSFYLWFHSSKMFPEVMSQCCKISSCPGEEASNVFTPH